MNRFIILLLTTTVVINQQAQMAEANQHYSYANTAKEDHHHQRQQHPLTSDARRIYQTNDYSNSNNNNLENNQASQLKLTNTIHNALAQEVLATYSSYGGLQETQQQQQPQPQIQTPPQQQPQPQHQQQHPQLNPQQPYQNTKYTSVQYNVLQHNDDGEVDIVYHQTASPEPEPVESHNVATQQEKPSLLAQLKSQHQELSEGYATFLQEAQNGSSDDNQQQQQQQAQPQHHPTQQQAQPQQQQTQLTNPQLLHYQKLQEQQQLYYQQLQQEELLQQQQYQQQLQHYQQQQAQQTQQQLLQQQLEIQQQLERQQQAQQVQQQLQQQQQHQIQYQQQQQQQPPHPTTAYVTPTAPSPPPPAPPSTPSPTPAPVTTTQATVHPNLHHQLQQQQPPAIVSHATSNEASPSQTPTSINPKPFQSLPPLYQRNQLADYAIVSGVKYAPHSKPYNHPPPPSGRHPAAVYGPPPYHGSKHSKQVIYAPMRFVYDRKLPYSTKTFPYPPSFISLTTTEKPLKYDHGSGNYYSHDHKSAYNKVPDLFVHRSSKSLLDSYIPSWQVIKMLQQFQHQTPAINQHTNLQTLAMPFRRNFQRSATDQGKPQ